MIGRAAGAHRWVIALVVAGAPLALLAALAMGSVDLGTERWALAVTGRGDADAHEIVWGLRAPRALAGFATGALLALAGALLQVLLRNPLADPYVLGVSGGAAVGGLGAMLLGLAAAWISVAALAGAVIVTAALVVFAASAGSWDTSRVLLAGVGFSAASGACVSLILTLAPAQQVHGMLFWLMGDLGAVADSRLAWLALAVALAAAWILADDIDLLALGPVKAATLGVAVERVQWIAFACAIVASAAAVLIAGAVGFVGLAVPHLLRLAGIHRHDRLLPLAALAGGTLVVIADTLARTVARPIELPVGAITALVGVPVLIYLLVRTR